MARRLPPLNGLRAFEAAARLGSFQAAGEELAVTQAAVSRIVRMNPMISPLGAPGAWCPPGPASNPMTVQQFIDMVQLDVDVLDQPLVDKIVDYTKLWIAGDAPNQPIREDTRTLAVELGDGQFKQAAGTWASLMSAY